MTGSDRTPAGPVARRLSRLRLLPGPGEAAGRFARQAAVGAVSSREHHPQPHFDRPHHPRARAQARTARTAPAPPTDTPYRAGRCRLVRAAPPGCAPPCRAAFVPRGSTGRQLARLVGTHTCPGRASGTVPPRLGPGPRKDGSEDAAPAPARSSPSAVPCGPPTAGPVPTVAPDTGGPGTGD